MDKSTREALLGSIEKWERIVAGTGQKFIRILKKDGTPSMQIGQDWQVWLPEGEKPAP